MPEGAYIVSMTPFGEYWLNVRLGGRSGETDFGDGLGVVALGGVYR